MIRKIIHIDEEKCNGCGACVNACHEGAIGLVNGKAKLMHEHYCDGLGDCLPSCPTNAITFEEREAPAYDEAAVLAAYYSQARSGTKVPVDYTPVKFVKKPAASRPGMVVYTTYQTMYVDPDGELVKKLGGK